MVACGLGKNIDRFLEWRREWRLVWPGGTRPSTSDTWTSGVPLEGNGCNGTWEGKDEASGEGTDGTNDPEEIDRVREWAAVLLCGTKDVRNGEVGGEWRLIAGGRGADFPVPSGGCKLDLLRAGIPGPKGGRE